ncbi:MAG: MFS transporter [Anaerolineae bacterium]|nr:MFS transporter [Anaerolineae bacterium]
MVDEPTTVEKLHKLPWAIASNASLAVFVQLTFFGSVFVLFLNELGLSTSQIGFVLSLLPFAGLLALVVAPAVARFGYKRTYITFFTIRHFVTALLLLTPWVVMRYGSQAALVFVTVIVGIFAVLRAIGVTASFPWTQEYVPNSVRGKYTATNNLASTMAGFLAISLASAVLARTTGLLGYDVIIAVGVVFGMGAVAFAAFIPGGAPQKSAPQASVAASPPKRDLRAGLSDPTLMRYLVGVGLMIVATVPLASFLPLFMNEEVGLSDSNVVGLQNAVLVGALVSSFLWGWAADRYGSKPVALSGVALRALLPVGWLLLPRHSPLSLPIATAIAFAQGIADVGWNVGSARMLYNSVVPPAKKSDYLALYFAWIGVFGGMSQLLGGRLVDATRTVRLGSGTPANPFLPLLLLGLFLPIVAAVVLRKLQDDSTLRFSQFPGLFLRGNPFLAIEAVIRYSRAGDEESVVKSTQRLGSAHSPLTVEELLEALEDPRFAVRFEAVVAITRAGSDPRLVDALARVMEGPEPALSTLAAWALGRVGDPAGGAALEKGLDSRYRSVQAHSSRSLGVLNNRVVVPEILQRLQDETDPGLQLAYASTLGQMQVEEATARVLVLLDAASNSSSRAELALAVARIVGDEAHFIQLLRQARREPDEPGTALAQAMLALHKRLRQEWAVADDFLADFDDCAMTLARHQLEEGIDCLADITDVLAQYVSDENQQLILYTCAERMSQHGADRIEFAVLALHTLGVG